MPRGNNKATTGQAFRIRAYLLGKSSDAAVAREIWSCGHSGTYSAYRGCLEHRKQQQQQQRQRQLTALAGATGTAAAQGQGHAGLPGAAVGSISAGMEGSVPYGVTNPQSLPATVKYSFEGVKHVLAEATAPVTAISFAALRNDLMVYGCADGELWRVALPAPGASGLRETQPTCTKARKMHCGSVVEVDWAFDNSQLLSVGRDGTLCLWDPTDPAFPCIRSVCAPASSFLCGRFHRVNFSLAMVGTSFGSVEVFNCSTGRLHSRCQVTPAGSGVQVTALDSSNHHVFLGDSSGLLHWAACELQGKQLSRLRPAGKLRLSSGGGAGGGGRNPATAAAAVTALQYVPFCRTTDTPVLMVAQQDGSISIVRANEIRHTADLYLRRVVSPAGPPNAATAASDGSLRGRPAAAASPSPSSSSSSSSSLAVAPLRRFCPAVCPLSVIQDVPLITYGSDDTAVYIVDVTARSFGGLSAASGANRGGSGLAATSDRPMTVTVLKAHRAAVTAVAWTYDEALLASADAEGAVVLWRRCRLF